MGRPPPQRLQRPGPDRRHVMTGLAGALLTAGAGRRAAAQPFEVDLALVLAVDCSWSVDDREFRLQMHGLAQAFRHPQIHDAIASGASGRILVAAVQWSHERNQLQFAPWTVLADGEDAAAFAALLDTAPRLVSAGATAIGAAMEFSAGLLRTSPLAATRNVIDISCDGRSNRGVLPHLARDRVTAQGMTVNGLVILDEWPTLDIYFLRNVVGGPGHFVVVADDYGAYGEAIHRKLLQEITGTGIA